MKITINNSAVPNITKSSSTKSDIRKVSSSLVDHFEKGTLHEFLDSQKYTKKEMVLFCKSANIDHTGMHVDEMIHALVKKMYSQEKTILEQLQLMVVGGNLLIRGGIALSAATVLIGTKFKELKAMYEAMQSLNGDGAGDGAGNGSKTFIEIILGLVLIGIISSFSFVSSRSEKEYSKSSSKLSKSYKQYNYVVQQQRRKRTSKIFKLNVIARNIKKNRLTSKKEKLKNEIRKENSIISKMKRALFGGFTGEQLQEQLNEINEKIQDT